MTMAGCLGVLTGLNLLVGGFEGWAAIRFFAGSAFPDATSRRRPCSSICSRRDCVGG